MHGDAPRIAPPKWRFLAHFGASGEGSVTDLQSQKQLISIGRSNVYHCRKPGQSGRRTEACDRPNRRVIDGHRDAALRGARASVRALAERLGAANVPSSHATNGVFKTGNTAGISKTQIAPKWCRINAVAT
jgi:hypothetical protein